MCVNCYIFKENKCILNNYWFCFLVLLEVCIVFIYVFGVIDYDFL